MCIRDSHYEEIGLFEISNPLWGLFFTLYIDIIIKNYGIYEENLEIASEVER